MDEREMIAAIQNEWPTKCFEAPSERLNGLMEEALERFPTSARMWCIRGNYLELLLRPWDDPTVIDRIIQCHEKSSELDPHASEPYESIAYLYDVFANDYAKAEEFFRKSLERGGGPDSFFGLARVFAQIGKRDEAISVLSRLPSEIQEREDFRHLREEIEQGFWE
jgi:tetratricopeptide (TPR) repeat protein